METIGEIQRTPDREDCVKRLFGDAGDANTSEYFSQSSEENVNSQMFSSPPVDVQASGIIYL